MFIVPRPVKSLPGDRRGVREISGAAQNRHIPGQVLPDGIGQIILELHLIGFSSQHRPDESGILAGRGTRSWLNVKRRNHAGGIQTERKQVAGAVTVVGYEVGGRAFENERLTVAAEEGKQRAVVA